MAIRCGVTLMPASRHWATSRSMPAAWAAPVGGDEDRRAGGAERRKRLTGEIFSAETVLSRGRQNEWSPYGAPHTNGRNNGRPRKYEPKIKRTDGSRRRISRQDATALRRPPTLLWPSHEIHVARS